MKARLMVLVGAFIVGLVMGSITIATTGCTQDWEQAEADAKRFAQKTPGSTGEVECAKKDSDGDGYCSCTIFMKSGQHQSVECGCERYCINCAEGCKVVDTIKFREGKRR